MAKPPTLPEAEERGLYVPDGKGIHTFSNGTSWDIWADSNCFECAFYSKDCAGEWCAFEGAALLGGVSPELAALFGWIQRTTEYGPLSGWRAPESCRFYKDKDEKGDDDRPHAPAPDPTQLVLIADPTEDAGMLRVVEVPEREPVSV